MTAVQQKLTDESIKQAFSESQQKLQSLFRQVTHCKQEINSKDRKSRSAKITASELLKLQSEGPIVSYKAVGRCFVKQNVESLITEKNAESDKEERNVRVLEKTKEYLENNITETEKGIKELLLRRKDAE